MAEESCCPPGSLPSLTPTTSYIPTGKEIVIENLPVYISNHTSETIPRSAVIIGYDIYGYHGGRIRHICDEIANAGYLVLLPDYFRGDCWSAEREATESATKIAWITRLADPTRLKLDIFQLLLPYCRNQYNTEKFAIAGFCFGGYVSFLACQDPTFSCGVGVHSSIKIFNFFDTNELAVTSTLQSPQLLIQGHNDPPNTKPNGDVHQGLAQLPFGDRCQVVELPEVAHGWLPRGDLNDPIVVANIAKTMQLMLAFLQQNL